MGAISSSQFPFVFLFPLSRDVRNTFDVRPFHRHRETLPFFDTITLHWKKKHPLGTFARTFILLFFFSAPDLAGLLILTVGVSPTRVFVSWCDVCPHSAVVGQGLMGNKAQSG